MRKTRLYKKEYKGLKIYRKRYTQIIALIIFFLSILPANTLSQSNNYINSNASLAEKVYLQLDRKVYTTDNIIWFKAIVLSAFNHVPSLLSGVLYVELIKPDETIFEKKLIKIEDGIGQGFFYLDKSLSEGLYLIRAYTQWNKNFETDFFYEDYIQVFSPEKESDKEKPIRNISLVKEQTNEDHLKACFNPFVIDSLHKSKLKVMITLDNKKDSLYIKKGKDNIYRIDYTIENNSQFATLQMQTENQQSYSTTIILNKDYLDLQFFPESGELVHGLRSKVGFKALDASAQGILIQGDIVDERDSVITSFKSNSLGMGSFDLNKTDSTKTYYARLISESNDNQVLLYPLPNIASNGNILSVEKQANNIRIEVLSNYMKDDSINLQISFRGVSFYEMKVRLKEGRFKLLIPSNELPEGIILCTMMDNSLHPLAERLYFNERPESRINIALSTDKETYSKRELTNLKIETTNSNGEPIKSNLSLLVINKQELGKMQSKRQNILSWYLLDSELKGEIEQPGYYFKNDSVAHSHLDALMLTQGWRKYHYVKPFKHLSFQAESNLSVSGQVSSLFSIKKKKEAELTMITFGKNKSVYSQVADSLGKFKFNLYNEYGKNVNVLIQSSKKSGKNMNYTITIDKKESPPITYNHIKTLEKLDSVVNKFVEKNIERKKIEDTYPLQSGDVLLDEVEIKAYRLTPNRKKVMERYGKPDVVIEGKAILEKEEKWSYGLYSVLLYNYPDKIRILRDSRFDILYANVIGSDLTYIVIDGIPAKFQDLKHIPYIPPSEVSSFEIIKCIENWQRLYSEITGVAPNQYLKTNGRASPKYISCVSVIAIYTHAKKGIYGVRKPVGIMKASVPVFSAHREFYAPKYKNPQSTDWTKPDLRALIHWEPIVKTNSWGMASSSFYNADNEGKMMVVIEAVSDNGEVGYQEIEYEIEQK